MIRKSTKMVAFVGLVALLLSLSVYAIFFKMVSAQKAQHTAYVTSSAEAAAHKASLQKLMQELEVTKPERDSLASRFVADEAVIDLLALIESIGREQGVLLATNSLNVVPNNDYFETLVVSISVTGQYNQIVKVLSLLETLPYQTTISQTQISRTETGEWAGTFTISITKFTKQ